MIYLFGHFERLRVFKCIKVKSAKNLDDYEIELVDSTDQKSVKYYLKDLIIRPKTIYLSIGKYTNKNETYKKHI